MTDEASPHVHRAAGRIAGRALRRNRWVNASLTAAHKVSTSIGRVIHTMFLETMGLFYMSFAITGGFATYRAYRVYGEAEVGLERVILGVAFTALFGYFSISSFWRARRRQVKEAK